MTSPSRGFLPQSVLVATAVMSSFAFTVATAAPARAQSTVDEAEALIRQGTELRHQSQDARALPYFDRAYSLARNPRTAAQLGLVKMALGYCVDAERLLDEALAVPDHPWIARNLNTLTETRALARKNIGELTVAGAPAGAEVLLNGHVIGKLPLPAALRLDKGPVEIQLRAPGHVAMSRSLQVTAGAHENLWVALSPSGGGAVAAPAGAMPSATAPSAAVSPSALAAPPPASVPSLAASAPTADSPAGRAWLLRPLAWTSAAGAAIGLTLGIVETVVATHRIDDFNHHTSSAMPGVVDCATGQLSDECRSIRDARDRARALAIVGYVGAGLFVATSATLFILSSRQTTGDIAPAVACAPSLPSPGLSCRLVF